MALTPVRSGKRQTPICHRKLRSRHLENEEWNTTTRVAERARMTNKSGRNDRTRASLSINDFLFLFSSSDPAHLGRDHLSAAERSVHTRPRSRHARSTHHARARHYEHTVINFMKNLLMINETDGPIHLISFSNTQRYECLSFHFACLNGLIFMAVVM